MGPSPQGLWRCRSPRLELPHPQGLPGASDVLRARLQVSGPAGCPTPSSAHPSLFRLSQLRRALPRRHPGPTAAPCTPGRFSRGGRRCSSASGAFLISFTRRPSPCATGMSTSTISSSTNAMLSAAVRHAGCHRRPALVATAGPPSAPKQARSVIVSAPYVCCRLSTALVDFGNMNFAQPLSDVAFFIATNVTVEARRELEVIPTITTHPPHAHPATHPQHVHAAT